MKNIFIILSLLIGSFSFSQNWDFVGGSSGYFGSEIKIEIGAQGTLYRAVKVTSGIRVQRWENTAWVNFGGLVGNSSSYDIELQVIGDNQPAVAYRGTFSGFDIISVALWSGTTWNQQANGTGAPMVTDVSKDYSLHVSPDYDVYLAYYDDYWDNELKVVHFDSTPNFVPGTFDDSNFGNAVDMYVDEDSYHWVANEQNDIGDYINMSKYGASWTSVGSFAGESIEDIVIEKQGNYMGAVFIENNGTSEILRFRGFDIYNDNFGTPVQLTSGSSITEVDMDGDNDMYVYYRSGTSNYIRRVSNLLTPTNSFLYTNPAPAGATNIGIEYHQGKMVISYRSGSYVFVKELNNPAIIVDWDDFEMCEMNPFNGDEFGLLVQDNNYDHPDIVVNITSQNTSVVPNSQINPVLMDQIGESLYYTYNISTTNDVATNTVVDLDWDVVEYSVSVATQSTGITVYDSPDITFNLPNTSLCNNSSPINLNGNAFPLNGEWEGPGIFNNTLFPQQMPAGGHYLIYTTVSSVTGCKGIDSILININPTPVLNVITNDADCNTNDGNAFVTISSGTSPFSTYWSNGETGTAAANLSPGQYFVNVTDFNGCIATAPAMIATNGLNVTGSITAVSCNDGQDGAIDVSVSGANAPFTYFWNNGVTSEDLNNVQAGPYEITVTDASECVSTASFTVPEPDAVTYVATTTKSTCGGNSGSISLAITAGNAPLTFMWTDVNSNSVGTNSSDLSGVPSGEYNCEIIDANGCTYYYNGVVTDILSPNIVIESITPSSCTNDGAIDISILPASNIASINWSNGATTEDVSSLLPGYYSVQVENNAGCTGTQGITVGFADPIEVQICLVTVDTNTVTNKVVWEKPVTASISHFNIYRETSTAGLFQFVDSVLYTDDSEFTDAIASPIIRSWRYKISSVDLCGNESDLSDYHKTIHLVINEGLGGVYNIAWDNYEGFSFVGFELWRKTDITPWENIQNMPTTLFSFTDDQVPTTNGLDYFLAINSPTTCSSTLNKAQDYNSSRSNKAEGKAQPGTNSISEELLEFNLYPNPTTGVLNFIWENSEPLFYSINDLNGRIVKQGTLQNSSSINLQNIDSGVYQFNTTFEGETTTQKIIKK